MSGPEMSIHVEAEIGLALPAAIPCSLLLLGKYVIDAHMYKT
jgi:hypothetical protein